MSAKEVTSFAESLRTALRNGTHDAYTLFNSQDVEIVKNGAWEITPVISECLTGRNKADNPALFECCVYIMKKISEISNAAETLLQLISEVEECTDNDKFVILLELLCTVIKRIPTKKINSYAWSFNAIQTYIRKLEQPDYSGFQHEERLLVEHTDNNTTIVNIYKKVTEFYKELVLSTIKHGDDESKLVFCKFLLQLLGPPLKYVPLEMIRNTTPACRIIANNIVDTIFILMDDPYIIYNRSVMREQDSLIKPELESVAQFFFLIYAEGMNSSKVPKVYSVEYTFHTLLDLCSVLLTGSDIIVIEKSLKLSEFMYTNLRQHKFQYPVLDHPAHAKFSELVTKIIIYHKEDFIRKQALTVFTHYLKLFETDGIYVIIYNLMCRITHSGLIGFMITFYKDTIHQEFTVHGHNIGDYVKGPKLYRMLRKFCFLEKKEETDLLQCSDQIISCLNLLRFLALRDKQNATGIWDFFNELNKDYMEPLKKGIELSKEHYKLEIKKINEEEISIKEFVTVNDQNLPPINKTEKLGILNVSLNAFDVIDSLLSRLVEAIDNKL